MKEKYFRGKKNHNAIFKKWDFDASVQWSSPATVLGRGEEVAPGKYSIVNKNNNDL